MATVRKLLPSAQEYFTELQVRVDHGNDQSFRRYQAAVKIQRIVRGFLIRRYIAKLNKNAIIIQCAFRVHQAKKVYREYLKDAVKRMHRRYYDKAAATIQSLWRGHISRRTKFNYSLYRLWLAKVTEKGERKVAEAAEFGLRCRIDDLQTLEEEARQWLAYVVFKLHHLLRTASCAGVFSDPTTKELTDFEKLLKSIKYRDYMNRLKKKYSDFVRKHRPLFSNKRLFPIIGDGSEYWYLSLPEMYELTASVTKDNDVVKTRHEPNHHGELHKKPFMLWKRVIPGKYKGRGPLKTDSTVTSLMVPSVPPPSITGEGDAKIDPRFNLYVRNYTPEPNLFKYIDYHINTLLKRRCSIENIYKNT